MGFRKNLQPGALKDLQESFGPIPSHLGHKQKILQPLQPRPIGCLKDFQESFSPIPWRHCHKQKIFQPHPVGLEMLQPRPVGF